MLILILAKDNMDYNRINEVNRNKSDSIIMKKKKQIKFENYDNSTTKILNFNVINKLNHQLIKIIMFLITFVFCLIQQQKQVNCSSQHARLLYNHFPSPSLMIPQAHNSIHQQQLHNQQNNNNNNHHHHHHRNNINNNRIVYNIEHQKYQLARQHNNNQIHNKITNPQRVQQSISLNTVTSPFSHAHLERENHNHHHRHHHHHNRYISKFHNHRPNQQHLQVADRRASGSVPSNNQQQQTINSNENQQQQAHVNNNNEDNNKKLLVCYYTTRSAGHNPSGYWPPPPPTKDSREFIMPAESLINLQTETMMVNQLQFGPTPSSSSAATTTATTSAGFAPIIHYEPYANNDLRLKQQQLYSANNLNSIQMGPQSVSEFGNVKNQQQQLVFKSAAFQQHQQANNPIQQNLQQKSNANGAGKAPNNGKFKQQQHSREDSISHMLVRTTTDHQDISGNSILFSGSDVNKFQTSKNKQTPAYNLIDGSELESGTTYSSTVPSSNNNGLIVAAGTTTTTTAAAATTTTAKDVGSLMGQQQQVTVPAFIPKSPAQSIMPIGIVEQEPQQQQELLVLMSGNNENNNLIKTSQNNNENHPERNSMKKQQHQQLVFSHHHSPPSQSSLLSSSSSASSTALSRAFIVGQASSNNEILDTKSQLFFPPSTPTLTSTTTTTTSSISIPTTTGANLSPSSSSIANNNLYQQHKDSLHQKQKAKNLQFPTLNDQLSSVGQQQQQLTNPFSGTVSSAPSVPLSSASLMHHQQQNQQQQAGYRNLQQQFSAAINGAPQLIANNNDAQRPFVNNHLANQQQQQQSSLVALKQHNYSSQPYSSLINSASTNNGLVASGADLLEQIKPTNPSLSTTTSNSLANTISLPAVSSSTLTGNDGGFAPPARIDIVGHTISKSNNQATSNIGEAEAAAAPLSLMSQAGTKLVGSGGGSTPTGVGLPSMLVSSPLSTVFDVFGAASQYLMRFKPSSLISPASFAFNTISTNEHQHGNQQQHHNHQHHTHHNQNQQQQQGKFSNYSSSLASSSFSAGAPHSSEHSAGGAAKAASDTALSSIIPLPFSATGLISTKSSPNDRSSTSSSSSSSSSAAAAGAGSSGGSGSHINSDSFGLGSSFLSRFSLSQNNQRREDVCGRTIQTPQRRIIGGEGARYGEFPYQVHIKIAKHQCGGALVDKQSIVTAAHCVYHFITRAPVSKLQIVIGAYDIEDEQYQELPPQYFKVNKVKLHPNFRFSASHPDRYDIAILKLDKPVKYTDNVLPVCLPSKDLKFENMVGTVTGFGKTDPSLSNRYGTRLLQKVDVPIIENNECERWHRTRGIDLKIFPEMMCAGYEDGLKDACVGDSGGPLVVKTSVGQNGSYRWTLAGITSAGFGCAQSRQPGIYHRVSHTVDWILENLD